MHQSVGDAELLRQYVQSRGQEAFAELVRRYVDMVYTSARRQVREPGLAEDVTQQVFVVLAARAKSLRPDTVLGAWLLSVARNESRNALKRLARRRRHERSAAEMKSRESQASQETDEARWEALEPLLDEALAGLSEGDRRAVVLRYFRNKSNREGAQELGISEPSMRQRVHRGIERMRTFLVSRGVRVSAAAFASGLAANAVASAPPGLAEGVAAQAAAAATATGGGGGALTIQKGAVLAMTKSNAFILTAAAVLLFAGAAAGWFALARANDERPPRKPVAAASTTSSTKPAQVASNTPPPPAEDPDFRTSATRGPAWKPGGHPMHIPINALSYDDKRGTRNGFDHIAFIEAGNWVRYADVELADGDNAVVMAIFCDKRYAGKVISLRLDDPDGPVVGKLAVKATPGTFEQQGTIIEGRKGRHDVYLTFSSGGFNIRTIKFTAGIRDATKLITASSHAAASFGVMERDTRVAGIGEGEWLRYDSIDFGAGVDTFQVDGSYHTSWGGRGAMQVRVDALDGPIIAQLTIGGGTEEGFVQATSQCAVKPVKGVHDVYLTFTGGDRVIDLSSFRFGRHPPSPATRAASPGSTQPSPASQRRPG
jgi:RNA polymerase sigma factor (sigma-70 family)